MGGFARVALPVAVGFAAPYAFGAAAGLASTVPITGGSIAAGTAGSTVFPTFVGNAAIGGALSGLKSGLSAHAQHRQNSAIARQQADAQRRETERLKKEFERNEEERKRKERQRLAQLRVQFAGQGRLGTEGSAAAVIGNLTRQSDDIRAQNVEGYRNGVEALLASNDRGPLNQSRSSQIGQGVGTIFGLAETGLSILEQ